MVAGETFDLLTSQQRSVSVPIEAGHARVISTMRTPIRHTDYADVTAKTHCVVTRQSLQGDVFPLRPTVQRSGHNADSSGSSPSSTNSFTGDSRPLPVLFGSPDRSVGSRVATAAKMVPEVSKDCVSVLSENRKDEMRLAKCEHALEA